MIHPRFTVRTLKSQNGTPRRLGIWDDDRGTFVRTLPLATSDRLVTRELDELADTLRSATVIFYTQRHTKKLAEPWELTVLTGDVVSQNHRERVVMDNSGNLHTVPTERHVRTVWGATVMKLSEARNADSGAITYDKIDVRGWTEPTHEELHHLDFHGTSKVWFADFALRYRLASKRIQWNESVAKGSRSRPLNANRDAQRLLRMWNREHPATARRLHRLTERTT